MSIGGLLSYETTTPLPPITTSIHRRRRPRSPELQRRPFIRKWIDKALIASLAVLSVDPISLALVKPKPPLDLQLNYPCEDVRRYYDGADELDGDKLLEKLNSIVSPHRSITYKDVWDALKILDAADADNPEASSEVVEIYSLRTVSKQLAGRQEGWNREHLWPRSYGLMDAPSLTDLHNIRPADVNVNSSRGNKYFGECLAVSTHCLRPANPEAAADTETDKKLWAPPSQVRGDIARSLMYMAVRYGYQKPNTNTHLQLSDSPNVGTREMGLLSVLLRWNELDPPSRVEKLRNDRICKLYQHNRNPFIDHPEYANLIWKHTSKNKLDAMSSLKAWISKLFTDAKTRISIFSP